MKTFKNGDIVRVGVHPKAKGTILFPVNYSQTLDIVVYRVEITDGFSINAPDTLLKLWETYDGNEVGNWADMRHIWQPEME